MTEPPVMPELLHLRVEGGVHPKKVSGLSVDYCDELKRTNEIKTAAPMLDAIDIAGLDITADALLTQRDLASYLVARGAHYHFTVKGNQPTLQETSAYCSSHAHSHTTANAQRRTTAASRHGASGSRCIDATSGAPVSLTTTSSSPTSAKSS